MILVRSFMMLLLAAYLVSCAAASNDNSDADSAKGYTIPDSVSATRAGNSYDTVSNAGGSTGSATPSDTPPQQR